MKKNLFNQQNTKNIYQQYLLLFILFFSGNTWGQTTIASEGFNNSASSFTVSGGAYYTGNSASGDRPATSAFTVEGSHSYGFTAPSTTTASATLTSVNFNTLAYTGLSLSFRLAAFSIGSTGNGVDATDLVNVEISPDGGTTYYSTIRVLGSTAGNAYWAYSATGVASTAYDGNVTPVDFQPTTTGSQTTAGYSTVTITGLPSVSNLKVRITLTNNATSERWVVDDFKLTGTSASSCTTPTSQPTSLVFGTTGASTVNATFTGVASPNTPSGYLILRSTNATVPTLVDGTSYTTNTDATIGGIVYRVLQGSATASLGTTIAETGLTSNTKYYYYIYSYNNNCTGQPYYLTTSPLTGDKTTCPAPATLPLSSVTNNSATVSWTASVVGGSAETIKYRFELYSDSGRTTPVAGYPLTDTTSPVSIAGLPSNTTYYYRIVAYNSSCQSTNLDGSFTTDCTYINTFPYNEGFNSSTLPSCFIATEGSTGASQHWESVTADGTNGVGTAKEGARFLRMNYFNASASYNTYDLTSVGFQLPVSPKQARFSIWMGANSGANNLQFQISVDGGAFNTIATYGANASNTSSSSPWEEKIIDLTSYANHNVKFRLKATSNFGTGRCNIAFDDFNIENLPSCFVPVAPFTGTMVAKDNVNITWGAPATAPANGYQYYLSTTNTAPLAGASPTGSVGAGVTTANITTGLVAGSTYYWWVRSNCGTTDKSEWVAGGNFYYGYCLPSSSNSTNYISNFSTTKGYTSNINNTSTYTTGGYQDNYATQKVEMYSTGSVDFSFTTPGGSAGTAIWVDWNNNLIFETSERVYSSGSSYTTGSTGSITVPNGQAVGDYRMRIRTMYLSNGDDVNPCTTQATRSEAEDYKFSVVAQPDYVIYTDAVSANNTVNNTLNIYFKDFDGYNNFYTNDQLEIWMHAGIKTSSATWQYQNAGQDFNNTSTLIKFTRESTNPNVYKATVKLADWFCIPTGTTVEGLNLVFRNQYGIGGNDQTADMVLNLTSAAVTVNVSTIGAASAVTTNSATISWTAPATGAVKGFDYYYSTSNTAPTAGTTPNGTVAGSVYTANLSSLSAATTYYFWVRTKGCDTNSAWSASGNFTTACTNISSFPWTENFDTMSTLGANVVPNCWMTTSGSQSWTSSNAVASTSSPGANSPSNYMRLQWNNSSASNLYTPGFTLNAGKSYDFTFYYRTSTTGSNGGGFNGDLYVNAEQSTTGSTFLGNFVTSTQNVGYTMYKYTFTPTTTGTFYFNLRATSNNATATYYLGVDDFRLEETPPTLLANNTSAVSLSFPDQAITTTSATQSFNLSGLMLTGAPGTITISAPAGFEVSSVDNTAWAASTTVNYSSSTLADKQINVRFKPTDCTPISNAVLTISGGGATVIPTVTLSGKGIISAPTAIAATDITATTFTANWQPVAGATGYELDVYKKGELLNTATEGFESGMTMTSYATGVGNFELVTGTWTMNRVIKSTTATNNYNNSASGAQLEGGSSSSIISPSYNKLKTLKFHARRGSSATTISIYKIVSGVETLLGTQALANSSPSQYSFDVNETSNDVKIKIVNGSAVAYIDNVLIDYYVANNDYVANYNPKVIVGNSVNSDIVTGLSQNTTYHYVVRAITSTCESVNSNEIAVTTNNTVVWNGSAWSNIDGPTATLDSKIIGAYNIPISFETNNLEITNTGSLDIKAQKDVTVYGNITLPADNKIVVESDANLVQKNVGADNNSNNTITVKRTALQPTKGYTFWSSPVANQNLYSFSNGYNSANGGTGTGTPWNRFFVYKESTDTFVTTISGEITLGASSVFDTGRGYAIRGKNSYTPTGGTGTEIPSTADEFSFTGKMRNGSLSSQILKNSCGSSVSEFDCTKGYNLIGNPYPSNIDFDALYNLNNTKIYGTAYFWTNNDIAATNVQQGSNYTGNNYAIYNLTGGTPAVEVDHYQLASANPIPNGTVKVGQGFIIKAKKVAAGTPIDFTNSVRMGYDADAHFYNSKRAEKNRFWLKMTSPANISNTILLGYINGATNGFEIDYDGELFVIGSDAFYSLLPNKKLAIQGKGEFTQDDVIPLGTKHAVNGMYKISLSKKDGIFSDGQKVYLKDKQNNTYTDLTSQDYTFNANQGVDDARFEIVYKNNEVLGVDSSKSDFIVYRDGNYFIIQSSKTLGKIELYDASGKLIQSIDTNKKEFRMDGSALLNGVYIIKAENSGNIRTKKIIK
ncbi:fibronectin type III domain-containing protein [Epilithonimonas arachidiradicis]|uniref:Putative secreted protein (Por secretion system target) n=1 Tax=Epilithonimonas arachidiradicis TaxID=1617282 RepID=A0A420DCM0_9FLAO|nr:fibronectin type III domain-containing protein [Epilithonimonas arachidiradicis]RKE88997.1 putative secreted protein (Por secretion system target) [Epilithonimonas arachidiradicis]GGG53373.1 hypothetical protein GCM10007332_13810 [Epilithonimonas arachidiradicis]